MGSIARSGLGTWDEASSPAATRLARRFEEAWRGSNPRQRPDPGSFLPEGPNSTPAAWLALLRVDLNLRWDDGQAVRVEIYRTNYPGLDPDTLVALCYEEFCRREEDGEAPFPSEYDERFPELSARLRRVFDIHELIGDAASTDLHVSGPELVPFPEAGQTIAGFHLVEELGRGSFARVFLARERQLADRPVALKVARSGSREPQTLARLQHTHIVPVHSYRTDPVTDLHLLCMPYFGRVTLGRLLNDPAARSAPTGRELLDTLDRLDPSEAKAGASSARTTLARLTFAQAIAWWGSRLAEALAHAHDRGVLHRDIKPSNVLVTCDALPMLLDFNLAGEPWAEAGGIEPESLGGTLAYMAPEHLDAVARHEDGRVDARSDLYSLGVLLFEALTGTRPFPTPLGASTVSEALRIAAEQRRAEPPSLRVTHPEVPAALERVIRRCLEPGPDARYPSASELALDLQAIADDAPLRFTREPLAVRFIRRVRRSWKKLALITPIIAGSVAFVMSVVREGEDLAKVEATATTLFNEGKQALLSGEFAIASARFDDVAKLTRDRADLVGVRLEALAHRRSAQETARVRAEVDTLTQASIDLRLRLILAQPGSSQVDVKLATALKPFRVLDDVEWSRSALLAYHLDPPRRAKLLREVDELLFLLATRKVPGDSESSRRGIELCDRALRFTEAPGPWKALRAWLDDSPELDRNTEPGLENSPLACFEWAVLLEREGRKNLAAAWLDRATDLARDDFWYHYQLGRIYAKTGTWNRALEQFEAAAALNPKTRWIDSERAEVFRLSGDRDRLRLMEERSIAPKAR